MLCIDYIKHFKIWRGDWHGYLDRDILTFQRSPIEIIVPRSRSLQSHTHKHLYPLPEHIHTHKK